MTLAESLPASLVSFCITLREVSFSSSHSKKRIPGKYSGKAARRRLRLFVEFLNVLS